MRPRPHKHIAPYAHTQSHTLPQKVPQTLDREVGERQRTIDHRCARRGDYSSSCPSFSGIFSRSEKTWRGWSPLFTQLAPWEGLLNMKYEESREGAGEEKREGSQERERERGIIGQRRERAKG